MARFFLQAQAALLSTPTVVMYAHFTMSSRLFLSSRPLDCCMSLSLVLLLTRDIHEPESSNCNTYIELYMLHDLITWCFLPPDVSNTNYANITPNCV